MKQQVEGIIFLNKDAKPRFSPWGNEHFFSKTILAGFCNGHFGKKVVIAASRNRHFGK